MKYPILIITLFLGFTSSLWAAQQTETHTYLLNADDASLLVIDRKTGEEKKIYVGPAAKSLTIHNNVGFVVLHHHRLILVIDLITHEVTKRISVEPFAQKVVIHENWGYVSMNDSNTLLLIDLITYTVEKTIQVGDKPAAMIIYNDLGYVRNWSSGDISVIDLETKTVLKTIPVGDIPTLQMHGAYGYVLNYDSGTLSVIDLATHTVEKTIIVGEKPTKMLIGKDYAYIKHDKYNNSSWFKPAQVNLKTHETKMHDLSEYPTDFKFIEDKVYLLYGDKNKVVVIHPRLTKCTAEINLFRKPISMSVDGGLCYIKHEDSKVISVLDLQTDTLLPSIHGLKEGLIDFSDTHIYCGLKKAAPKSAKKDALLGDQPIQVSFFDDKEYQLYGDDPKLVVLNPEHHVSIAEIKLPKNPTKMYVSRRFCEIYYKGSYTRFLVDLSTYELRK